MVCYLKSEGAPDNSSVQIRGKVRCKELQTHIILCSVSKVLERLVFDHITTFAVPLITTSQFGFVKGKSSQQQLLVMVHQITLNLKAKLATDVAYLDSCKDFDSDILLSKLYSLGITGQVYRWLKAYLSHRTQLVSINGTKSSPLPGVPQGSILGHLLFVLFINDLPLSIKRSVALLFADDTKCFHSCDKNLSLSSPLQEDLVTLSEWCQNNGTWYGPN